MNMIYNTNLTSFFLFTKGYSIQLKYKWGWLAMMNLQFSDYKKKQSLLDVFTWVVLIYGAHFILFW
jgi:hypothetical protein